MYNIESFQLTKWLDHHGKDASLVLAGSDAPPLSLQDLIELSSDKQETSSNLSLNAVRLYLRSTCGSEALRNQIATLYSGGDITADSFLATNGATGANSLAFQSLLKPGDHVISMYPSFTQLLSVPRALVGVNISYWTLDLDNQARPNMEQLKGLIRPTTRMISLNNPNNPSGTALSLSNQRELVRLAREHGIILVIDEIFHPMFHGGESLPSFLEISDESDMVVITNSLSKTWGLSGVRAGWLGTKNAELRAKCYEVGAYTFLGVSAMDDMVATEALSSRCRPQILRKHQEMARENIGLLGSFIEKHGDICSWIRPTAGSMAFVRFFSNKTGAPVDGVDFCLSLKERTGILLTPGSLCFAVDDAPECHGWVRFHLTVQPEHMRSALERISLFVSSWVPRQ